MSKQSETVQLTTTLAQRQMLSELFMGAFYPVTIDNCKKVRGVRRAVKLHHAQKHAERLDDEWQEKVKAWRIRSKKEPDYDEPSPKGLDWYGLNEMAERTDEVQRTHLLFVQELILAHDWSRPKGVDGKPMHIKVNLAKQEIAADLADAVATALGSD